MKQQGSSARPASNNEPPAQSRGWASVPHAEEFSKQLELFLLGFYV